MKLNIQMFAKKEDDVKEVSAEDLANITIDLDIEKSAKEEALKESAKLQKQVEDLLKANNRLMKRISEKDEVEEKRTESTFNKNAKITDLYDFSKGKLVYKDK